MTGKHSAIGIGVAGSAYRGDRVRPLLRAIKSALDLQHQRLLTCEELGVMCGQGHSAVSEKLHRVHQPQVEALLGWLERLPPDVRSRCIEAACRIHPTIEHARISHDPIMVSRLRGLLRQPNGLTLIRDGGPAARTFLVTALGHSFAMLRKKDSVRGVDAHEPDWFVPLADVIYVSPGTGKSLNDTIVRIWRSVTKSRGGLIILNGVWSVLEPMVDEVFAAAALSHVLLADGLRFEKVRFAERAKAPVNLLHVSEAKDNRLRIIVD